MNNDLKSYEHLLVCPETKQKLRLGTKEEAEAIAGAAFVALRVPQGEEKAKSPPSGVTPQLLLREDDACAYPVVDGVPILMVPEMLGKAGTARSFDLKDARYDEAYSEMAFYNQVAMDEAVRIKETESFQELLPIINASEEERADFPKPRSIWLDSIYDCTAQWEAYEHLVPLAKKRIMQLGGRGYHAVKFLLGGAEEAWVVTPMLGEIRFAQALAEAAGVADRLRCVVAVAEELPLASDTFDAIYSGGCVHHMVTDLALPETARVLKPGGSFSAADPWRTPFHHIGTKVFGKREAVHCRPLTHERIASFSKSFGEHVIVQHGTLTRHLLLALNKLGVSSSMSAAWWLTALDDRVSSLLPGFRGMGSSVVLLGRKEFEDSAEKVGESVSEAPAALTDAA